MTKYKEYIETLLNHHYKKLLDKEQKKYDDVLEQLMSDNQLISGVEMIYEKIANMSEDVLPILSVQYKVSNISVDKEKNLTLEYTNISKEDLEYYSVTKMTGLDDVEGLSWNSESQFFEGIAKTSGTFDLEIEGVYTSPKGFKQKTFGKCNLTVIPDPKSLWKTLEPDKSIPYAKVHEENKMAISQDGSRLLYASKRGRSHAHAATYRDDDGELLVSDSGWSIIAIADGGGSYALSRRGSKIAVDNSIAALEKVLSGQLGKDLEKAFFRNEELNNSESKNTLDVMLKNTMVSAAYTGFNGIVNEAKKNSKEIKDYSTTLLISAHKLTPHGHLVVSFWVGDGVIVVYSKGKEVVLLGEPDSGEFAGQTRFLDNSFFHDTSRVSIQVVDDFTALILATDGVSDPYFETDEALGSINKWDSFWENISEYVTNDDISTASIQLLSWLDFWSKGNHDDRTIALLQPLFEQKGEMSAEDKNNDEAIDPKEERGSNVSNNEPLANTIGDDDIELESSIDTMKNEVEVKNNDKNKDSIENKDRDESIDIEKEVETTDSEISSHDFLPDTEPNNEQELSVDTIENEVEVKDNDNNA